MLRRFDSDRRHMTAKNKFKKDNILLILRKALQSPCILKSPYENQSAYAGFFVYRKEVMENGMTEKQKLFADEYIIELNATRAYKKAYPNIKNDDVARTNGSRLLAKANVKAYIDEQLEKLKSERVADQQEVLEFLTAVMRGEITEPLLVLDGDGYQKVMDAKPNVSTRKSAAVDLGKRYGLFIDRQEITQKTIDIKVGDWDDNEE